MQEIIDIHAHVLPGLDDGAADMEEAKAMLQMAYSQGIRKIIVTPHYKRGQDPKQIMELSRKLQGEARKIHKCFNVYLGQEILYCEDILQDLKERRALTMCGSHYVLIEFPPLVPYSRMFQSLRKIILARYIPILAHMERYTCLREKGRVKELINSGCIMQMNYCSIAGSRFNRQVRWCRLQIRYGNIHMLGTDMHHMNERTPEIEKALVWIKKSCSLEMYHNLTGNYALNILKKKNNNRSKNENK
ncbi:CpsB/CapC family capsule biosynthesis tyrosine phosphatase [Lacrimispora sp.]|uniref:CpsB/CapC family capsule biosynthesis tyrosine phosphatase n=1 Tax=Lacrimispora sp. TaxID=2719234 RepID=UPI0029E5E0F3|nr:protein-tyrosine phosphatase [Lacrimispora sp.]